jgi:hypothetical protein
VWFTVWVMSNVHERYWHVYSSTYTHTHTHTHTNTHTNTNTHTHTTYIYILLQTIRDELLFWLINREKKPYLWSFQFSFHFSALWSKGICRGCVFSSVFIYILRNYPIYLGEISYWWSKMKAVGRSLDSHYFI